MLVRRLAGELTPAAGTVHRPGAVSVLPRNFRPAQEATLADVLRIDERLAALRRLNAGAATLADV